MACASVGQEVRGSRPAGPAVGFTGVRPVAWAVFAFLYIPIVVLVALSFNAGQSATLWQGFEPQVVLGGGQ